MYCCDQYRIREGHTGLRNWVVITWSRRCFEFLMLGLESVTHLSYFHLFRVWIRSAYWKTCTDIDLCCLFGDVHVPWTMQMQRHMIMQEQRKQEIHTIAYLRAIPWLFRGPRYMQIPPPPPVLFSKSGISNTRKILINHVCICWTCFFNLKWRFILEKRIRDYNY